MTLFCSTHTHLINKLSIDPVGRFNSHIFALENPSVLAPSKSLTNYVLMQTATSTSIRLLPPSTAVVPIQYPTWAPFKQYVMRPPRCLTFYVSFPFFFTFFFSSFSFFFLLWQATTRQGSSSNSLPPGLGNKWPNKQACKIFRGRKSRRDKGMEWNGKARKDDDV